MGYYALGGGDTTGSYNTGVGDQALTGSAGSATGSYNVALGYMAGSVPAGQTMGNRNVMIGAYTNSGSSDNGIAIGYGQSVGTNSLNIGGAIFGTGMTGSATTPAGNIGIDVRNPNSTLQVAGSVSAPVKVVSGTYQLTATDYTVVFRAAGGQVTLLPASAATDGTGNAGRVYRIVAQNTTVNIGTAITGFDGVLR